MKRRRAASPSVMALRSSRRRATGIRAVVVSISSCATFAATIARASVTSSAADNRGCAPISSRYRRSKSASSPRAATARVPAIGGEGSCSRARTSDGDFSSDRHSCQRGRRAARQPQPAHARRYGGAEFDTPNLDRFAQRVGAVRRTTTPARCRACPARHDMLVRRARLPLAAVGLDRAVGGGRSPCAAATRRRRRRCSSPTIRTCSRPAARTTTATSPRGTTSAATRATRGGPAPTRSWIGAPAVRPRARRRRTTDSRAWFRAEDDFPGPRTMAAAGAVARRRSAGTARPVLPASSTSSIRTSRSTRPSRGRRCTTPTGTGPHLDLAAVHRRRDRQGRASTERQGRQIRAQYGAKLTMIDHWFGRVLDALDRDGLVGRHRGDRVHRPRPLPRREGHLGQAGCAGVRAARSHPAARSRGPACAPASTCDALTTNVDLHATIADVFGVASPQRTHGRSLVPLLDGARRRRCATGRSPACGAARCTSIDERHEVRARAGRRQRAAVDVVEPVVDDADARRCPTCALPAPDDRARARPHAGLRRARDPPAVRAGRPSAVLGRDGRFGGNHLFDLDDDPDEEHNLAGTRREAEMAELLRVRVDRDGSASRSTRPPGPGLSSVCASARRIGRSGAQTVRRQGAGSLDSFSGAWRSLVSAPPLQGGGRGFESLSAHEDQRSVVPVAAVNPPSNQPLDALRAQASDSELIATISSTSTTGTTSTSFQ